MKPSPNIYHIPALLFWRYFMSGKKYFKNPGIIWEQNPENYNNHIIMHIEGYYNSTICVKTGTFCSRNRRICSYYPAPIPK